MVGSIGRFPFGEDDVEAALRRGQELFDDFGRVLQIAIHHDDIVAAALLQPRRDGDLLTEIAGQLAGDHMRVALRKLPQYSPGSVAERGRRRR